MIKVFAKIFKNLQQSQSSKICKKFHHRYLAGSKHAVFFSQVNRFTYLRP